MTQQPAQSPRPGNSPFGSLPRQAATPNAPATPAVPATPPQPVPAPAPAKPGSLLSRMPPKTNWRTVAVVPELVRFDLNGLGDPFHRLVGKKLDVNLGDPAAVIKALEDGGDDVAEMVRQLDAAWQNYAFKGALLVYLWRKETRLLLSGKLPAANENEAEEPYDDDKPTPPKILRALDLLLVLNVLARTRSNILLPDAPLALEGQYLNRSLYTDDARLIALVQATGCIEEALK